MEKAKKALRWSAGPGNCKSGGDESVELEGALNDGKARNRQFILVRPSSRLVLAGWFDVYGKLVKDGDRPEAVMHTIRCDGNRPKGPARLYPEDDRLEAWRERSRQSWAELHGGGKCRLDRRSSRFKRIDRPGAGGKRAGCGWNVGII